MSAKQALPPIAIQQFIKIYSKHVGVTLSIKEASKHANDFLEMYYYLINPVKEHSL